MRKSNTANNKNGATTANLGFEAKLWAAADALRNNMDAAEYKHVVLYRIAPGRLQTGCNDSAMLANAIHGKPVKWCC